MNTPQKTGVARRIAEELELELLGEELLVVSYRLKMADRTYGSLLASLEKTHGPHRFFWPRDAKSAMDEATGELVRLARRYCDVSERVEGLRLGENKA